MAITLRSFEKLLGKVNDGQFILHGEGDDAKLSRVNRGKSDFTRKYIYKQENLEGQGAENARTREELYKAICNSDGGKALSKDYLDKLRKDLGLDSEDTSKVQLECLRAKQIIVSAKAAIAEAREKEFDLTNAEAKIPEPRELPPQDAERKMLPAEEHDRIKPELETELADLKVEYRDRLLECGRQAVQNIIDGLAKGKLVSVTMPGDTVTDDVISDFEKRMILATLTKHGDDLFTGKIDSLMVLEDRPYTELDDYEYNPDKVHEQDDIRLLRQQINQLNVESGMEDLQIEIDNRMAYFHKALSESIKTAETVRPEDYPSENIVLNQMTKCECPTTGSFRAAAPGIFANHYIRERAEKLFALIEQRFTEGVAHKVGGLANKTLGELEPDFEKTTREKYRERLEAVRELLKGKEDGPVYDWQRIDRQLKDIEFNVRCDFLNKQYELGKKFESNFS